MNQPSPADVFIAANRDADVLHVPTNRVGQVTGSTELVRVKGSQVRHVSVRFTDGYAKPVDPKDLKVLPKPAPGVVYADATRDFDAEYHHHLDLVGIGAA